MNIDSKWVNLLLILFLFLPIDNTHAQEVEEPEGPVYIVQQGDTLWDIAQRFGVSMDDLANINQINEPNQLQVGSQLIIPGMQGLNGILTTRTVSIGETVRSMSRKHQVRLDQLERLNHLTSPNELYIGSSLILPESDDTNSTQGERATLQTGMSLLEIAVTKDINPWTPVLINNLAGSWGALPGEILYLPGVNDDGPGALPKEIKQIELKSLPLTQGKTASVRLTSDLMISLTGSLAGEELNFFRDTDNSLIALQGVHGLIEPGLHSLTLKGEFPDGTPFGISQMVFVQDGQYPYDRPLIVDPDTIDPAVTEPEDKLWESLSSSASPDKLWNDVFQIPSPLPADYCLETGDCWSSRFGNRRSYNGGPYDHFHTGLDIVGMIGREIFAPAPGIVVYSGEMTVRGKATMINHGWGVYTAYLHQSEIFVKAGEQVETKQLIGLIGNTGRVEGPHLHWEVIVGGIPVDPLEWLLKTFP